jgi:hypothetical protein
LLTFSDNAKSVLGHVTRIRNHPLIPNDIPIYGYIYDVKSGRLVEVPEATTAGKASSFPVTALRHRSAGSRRATAAGPSSVVSSSVSSETRSEPSTAVKAPIKTAVVITTTMGEYETSGSTNSTEVGANSLGV